MEGPNEKSNSTRQELLTSGTAFKILETNFDLTPLIGPLTFRGRHLTCFQHVAVVPGHNSSPCWRKQEDIFSVFGGAKNTHTHTHVRTERAVPATMTFQ